MSRQQHNTHERLITSVKELTTARQTFYTTPTKLSPRVSHVLVSNKTGGNVTFTLELYEAATSTYFSIATEEVLAANSRVLLSGDINPLISLKSQDLITCKASANSSIDCIVVVVEQESRGVS